MTPEHPSGPGADELSQRTNRRAYERAQHSAMPSWLQYHWLSHGHRGDTLRALGQHDLAPNAVGLASSNLRSLSVLASTPGRESAWKTRHWTSLRDDRSCDYEAKSPTPHLDLGSSSPDDELISATNSSRGRRGLQAVLGGGPRPGPVNRRRQVPSRGWQRRPHRQVSRRFRWGQPPCRSSSCCPVTAL